MKLSDKMGTWGFLACIRSCYSDVLGSGYCGRGETPLSCAEEVNGWHCKRHSCCRGWSLGPESTQHTFAFEDYFLQNLLK